MTEITHIGFLGFGEAGRAMADSLHGTNPSLHLFAFDKANVPDHQAVTLLPDAKALAEHCQLVISGVTADEALTAAQSVAPYLTNGHVLADGNSVSPGTKRQAAETIGANGAAYVDCAIMAPIHPRGHKTPMLMAGSCQDELVPFLDDCGFSYDWEGQDIGSASIVKMLRSVLIKGVECLIAESVAASQGLGLDGRILQSAGKTLGIEDMPKLADYVMERAATHGRRRAAEMREVAKTLDELGLSNEMSKATALTQDSIADMNLAAQFDNDIPRDRHQLAPAMRAAQKSSK